MYANVNSVHSAGSCKPACLWHASSQRNHETNGASGLRLVRTPLHCTVSILCCEPRQCTMAPITAQVRHARPFWAHNVQETWSLTAGAVSAPTRPIRLQNDKRKCLCLCLELSLVAPTMVKCCLKNLDPCRLRTCKVLWGPAACGRMAWEHGRSIVWSSEALCFADCKQCDLIGKISRTPPPLFLHIMSYENTGTYRNSWRMVV